MVGVLVVLTVVVAVVFGGAHTPHPAAIDPDNPGTSGAQALARVLARDGVDVQVVRTADAFDRARVDASTTVVVTSTDQLGRSTAGRLLEHVGASDVIVVDASYPTLRALGIDDGPADVDDTSDPGLTASCPGTLGGLLDGLRLTVDSAVSYRGAGCFAAGDGRSVLTSTPDDGGTVTLFGAGLALTNDQILRGDDAAVALRLLGQHPRLVWYVPTVDDLSGGDAVGLRSVLPDWLVPSLGAGTLALLLMILWRGRRLGPLVTEPLPVAVRAAETTRSRGRLYRRAADQPHAARVLRAASRARIAARLGLAGLPPMETLVRDVVRRTGRPEPEIAALLADDASPPPTTDADLIRLAAGLAALEEEVRRP